jgi:hypothetical protein
LKRKEFSQPTQRVYRIKDIPQKLPMIGSGPPLFQVGQTGSIDPVERLYDSNMTLLNATDALGKYPFSLRIQQK